MSYLWPYLRQCSINRLACLLFFYVEMALAGNILPRINRANGPRICLFSHISASNKPSQFPFGSRVTSFAGPLRDSRRVPGGFCARDADWSQSGKPIPYGMRYPCGSRQMFIISSDIAFPLFTARCYASAVLAMALCLSVCPSVRLSVRHKSELY